MRNNNIWIEEMFSPYDYPRTTGVATPDVPSPPERITAKDRIRDLIAVANWTAEAYRDGRELRRQLHGYELRLQVEDQLRPGQSVRLQLGGYDYDTETFSTINLGSTDEPEALGSSLEYNIQGPNNLCTMLQRDLFTMTQALKDGGQKIQVVPLDRSPRDRRERNPFDPREFRDIVRPRIDRDRDPYDDPIERIA